MKRFQTLFPRIFIFFVTTLVSGCLRYTPDPYRYIGSNRNHEQVGQVMRSFYSQMSQINELSTAMQGVPLRFFLQPGRYTFTLRPITPGKILKGEPQIIHDLTPRELLVICSQNLRDSYSYYSLSLKEYPNYTDDDWTGDNSCDLHFAVKHGQPLPKKFTTPRDPKEPFEVIPELQDKEGKSIYQLAKETNNQTVVNWVEARYPRVKVKNR